MDLSVRVAAGLTCSLAIALFALRRGSLSGSGAVAALLIGASIFAGGGPSWFLALFAFFATSTLLGKVGTAHKEALKREFEKGDTRDAYQAFSNGGVAALSALAMLVSPEPWLVGAFVGALATATGDTWATELGTLSAKDPLSLLTFRRVPRGTSGAVSALGVAATGLGGVLIGTVVGAGPSHVTALSAPQLALLGLVTGVLGSLVDSVLGATVQAGYHCPRCAVATEGARHQCGQDTQLVRGLRWFDNDLVNLLATTAGAALGALWVFICGRLLA